MSDKITAEAPGRFSVRDLSDDALARLARHYRRTREDGIPAPKSITSDMRVEQLIRFSLRMRYGAVDDHVGTRSYDRWYRLDEAPTYALALRIDHARWRLGQRHALLWD